MMLSLFSGVSGLKSFQTGMDVIGNNIANVSTPGFKGSSAAFAETLTQTLKSATAPQGNRGGTNPQQIGLGVSVSAIKVNQTQGNTQSTGNANDLAIKGEGFFIVNNGNKNFYTRAGSLTLDENYNLASIANGYIVQGWMADASGNVDSTQPSGNIKVPIGQIMPPQATTKATLTGNLDEKTAVGGKQTTSVEAYDSLGNKDIITVTYTKLAVNLVGPPVIQPNTWQVDYQVNGGNSTTAGNITFTAGHIPATSFTMNGIEVKFGSITQYALDKSEVKSTPDDGYATGKLETIGFDSNGYVVGTYSNGLTQNVAQIALATFANSSGLTNNGGTLFSVSSNSGSPIIGTAGQGSKGTLATSSLEMSNVSLAEEFSNMIVTQRGYQANSRIITTSDEMLQELVNLKR